MLLYLIHVTNNLQVKNRDESVVVKMNEASWYSLFGMVFVVVMVGLFIALLIGYFKVKQKRIETEKDYILERLKQEVEENEKELQSLHQQLNEERDQRQKHTYVIEGLLEEVK